MNKIILVLLALVSLVGCADTQVRAPNGVEQQEVYTLVVKVWERKALSLPGVQQTHKAEKSGTNFIGAEHTSSKHGRQFREANAAGTLAHSIVARKFRVSLINTPQDRTGETTITDELRLPDVTITGSKDLLFTLQQVDDWDAIRIIAVNGDVESPHVFKETGLRELRFYNKQRGKKRGEWDNPLERPRYKRVHFIE